MSSAPFIYVNLPEEEEQRKVRLVTISRQQVLDELEKRTFKFVDASEAGGDNRQGAAVSADGENRVDAAILARNMEYRDAKIRNLIRHSLADCVDTAADNYLDPDKYFQYYLNVPVSFLDGDLATIKTFIHRYLIVGSLYDWYADEGLAQAQKYEKDILAVEADLDNILRRPSIEKKPMQPFGPAKFPF